ncbi:MAG TPA: hypothetical protein GXZ90_06325 [Clostridiales bacterium]|nr:hypothetical protein [Clostridiales bacterium]
MYWEINTIKQNDIWRLVIIDREDKYIITYVDNLDKQYVKHIVNHHNLSIDNALREGARIVMDVNKRIN